MAALRHGDLANIKGAILVVVILRLAFNLAKIDQPFTLTGGGPGYETSVLSILMYRFAFMSGDFGMAFTVGMFLVAMTAILILPFAWLFQPVPTAEHGAMSDDRSTLTQKLLTYGALAFVLALILIPYLYVIVTAFKTPGEIYETSWLPREISLQAWRDVFVINDFHVYLFNSLIAGVGSALLAVAISLPGAYIFARKEFPCASRSST